jgi:hypothetical protein
MTRLGAGVVVSALARRRGRIVGTDMRCLSFVHQVPSDCEEHEKDGDDDPNIDAEHLNSPFARPGSFIVVPIAATSRGRSSFWERYAGRNIMPIARSYSPVSQPLFFNCASHV